MLLYLLGDLYWLCHQGWIHPRANLQDLGVTPDEVSFLKVRLQEAEEPVSEFLDPALRDPALTIEPVTSETAARLFLPRCPACKGRNSHKKHSRVIGECDKAVRPSGSELLPFTWSKMSGPVEENLQKNTTYARRRFWITTNTRMTTWRQPFQLLFHACPRGHCVDSN